MIERHSREAALLPAPPLLVTEAEDQFAAIQTALDQEIKPRGIIEKIYLQDMTVLVWEVWRLRRCKVAIINWEFRAALATLLTRLLSEPGADPIRIDDEAAALAEAWFTDTAAKERVAELLRASQLDESAVEAEAIRRLAADLERLDRMIASAESRRNKALRSIAEYRGGLAQLLREAGDRIIDSKTLALEGPSSKRTSAAA
jgi:hypothetical protein